MANNLHKSKRLGGWFTDFKSVAGDAVTGTFHVVQEGTRMTGAALSGDFDRMTDKAGSIYDTVAQGVQTTVRVAGNIFDDASSAKAVLNEPPPGYMYDDKTGELVPARAATRISATRGPSVGQSATTNPLLLAGLAIAAKIIFFK